MSSQSVKEQVIQQSIDRINKRVKEIDSIINSNPLGDIIRLRKEAQSKLDEAREKGTDMSDEFSQYIKRCAKKEKELFDLAEKQKDSIALIEEKVKLQSELFSLCNERSLIEIRKGRK